MALVELKLLQLQVNLRVLVFSPAALFDQPQVLGYDGKELESRLQHQVCDEDKVELSGGLSNYFCLLVQYHGKHDHRVLVERWDRIV